MEKSIAFLGEIVSSKKEVKKAIKSVIAELMDRVIRKVLVDDPFIPEEHKFKKPLYAALVPDEIFKGSHFERRFTTPFGKVWEKLACASAKQGLGVGILGHKVEGMVKKERLRRIAEVLNKLEHPSRESGRRMKPDWDSELKYILKGGGRSIPTTIVCDLYAEDKKNGRKYAFELKAPLPNSDQTKVSKEKMLKLYSMEPKKLVTHFMRYLIIRMVVKRIMIGVFPSVGLIC